MKILSIETSCDDTAITIFEVNGSSTNANFKILANNSNSQIKVHIPHGGVYPALAKREHEKNLPIVLEASLLEAKLNKKERPVDALMVTYGPGLEMCLWEGITFAKNLAKMWGVPLVPVNHMEGHVLSVFGKDKGRFKISKLKTPALALLVSGGHTQLVLMKKWMQYEIIGTTLDDAVGEAFDKVARTIGLPYPGGPHISKLAESLRHARGGSSAQADAPSKAIRKHANMRADSERTSGFRLPRPMLHSKNFNFSFSGLKTAVLYLTQKIGKLTKKKQSEIALEFENAAIECLTYKTAKAIEKYKVKTLIVAGGVAANTHLRNEMKKICGQGTKLMFPTRLLTTDNSIMIGIAGYLNFAKNKKKVPKVESIKATGNLRL